LLILTAVLSLGLVGLIIGIGLAMANRKFSVEVDPREILINDCLPGANCGACGYPGCSGYAAAVCEGEAAIGQCPVGGKKVSDKIAIIMGEEAVEFEPRIARVLCAGGKEECGLRYFYAGIPSCRAANLIASGAKACTYGCLEMGDCVPVCPFGAIRMGENGLPIIDEERCVACGKCVEACPRKIISLIPKSCRVVIECSSHDRAPEVRRVCKVGCIACRACEKVCEAKAITIQDNLARIGPEKCTNCGACVAKCPRKVIHNVDEERRTMEEAA